MLRLPPDACSCIKPKLLAAMHNAVFMPWVPLGVQSLRRGWQTPSLQQCLLSAGVQSQRCSRLCVTWYLGSCAHHLAPAARPPQMTWRKAPPKVLMPFVVPRPFQQHEQNLIRLKDS